MVKLLALCLLAGCELFANIPNGTFVPPTDVPEGDCVTGEVTCAAPTPVCRTDTATCVECLGDGDCGGLPCDLSTNVCGPGCITDDQCPSGSCLADRTCADEARVLYVAPAGTGDCARATPCALETAIPLLSGRDVIQLATGTHVTANPITLTVGAIFNGTNAVIQVPTGQFGFTHGTVAVQYHRLAIEAPGGGIPVQCQTNGTISLVNVELRNSGAALFSSSCTTEIDRSRLVNNTSFAFSISGGGVLTIKNSYITNNGNTGVAIGTMLMDGIGADSTVEHTTIAGNLNNGSVPAAMSCGNGVGPTFKNSIIRNNGIPATCTVSNSVIDGGYTGPGVDNLIIDPAFIDPVANNYHLMPGSAAANATTQPTTLTLDGDNESRPQPAGSKPDFGADEIP